MTQGQAALATTASIAPVRQAFDADAAALAAKRDVERVSQAARRDAQRLMDASIRGDAATVVSLTYPRAVEVNGGAAKLTAAMAQALQANPNSGFRQSTASTGQPHTIVRNGSSVWLIVPQVMHMPVRPGPLNGPARLVQETFLVGFSSDEGSTWTFIDGSAMADAAAVRENLPEMPKDLKFPAQRRSRLIEETP